ncbi:four helix bundle protein [Pseudoalteromonas sp. SS15]|uniref:four helix bundle protein n=1 Tax=Pseudoalteromonas sp. SS15 TaxID=3139393 RepID=UPI003BAB9986
MRFEDLEVWRRSLALSCSVYKAFKLSKEYGLKDQITRSSLSIPSNIAEGYERITAKDCIKFLSYAKGSCGELRTQLYIAREINELSQDCANAWIAETEQLSKMIGGLMKSISRTI